LFLYFSINFVLSKRCLCWPRAQWWPSPCWCWPLRSSATSSYRYRRGLMTSCFAPPPHLTRRAGCQVRPAGWGASIPALSRWATMRLFQADQMHVALVQLRNSLGPIFLLPYAPPAPLVGRRGEWAGFTMVTDLGASADPCRLPPSSTPWW
jgi:hypothetical protein